ncbi:MAG: hypothetical protein PHH77_02825 [Victivallaceae bacterium]|nr:hypothetical protein [Victivallaceae bacterium]
MIQKRIIRVIFCPAAVVLLFLAAGCGKPETGTAASSVNIVPDPSFEKAKIFNSGIYKKGKYPVEKPAGWKTGYQVFNDFTGWATDEAHSGRRSLKIENTGKTDALWQGEPVVFTKPANAFEISIWTKTKEFKGKGRVQLFLEVYLKGDKENEPGSEIVMELPQAVHDWEQTKETVLFTANVVKVVPRLYFSGVTGTVWFDDLDIYRRETVLGNNILQNSNMEEAGGGKVASWILTRVTPGSVWEEDQGNHSLKIENELRSTHWDSVRVPILRPAKYFYLEGRVKADKWSGTDGDHTQIDAMFFYKDGSRSKYYPIDFPKGTYDWLKKSRHIALPAYPDQVRIVMISSGSGRVWFDDVKLCPIYLKSASLPEKRTEGTQ